MVNYSELKENMMAKGFTSKEVDLLTNWWPEDWQWLMDSSEEEIRAASVDAFEVDEQGF